MILTLLITLLTALCFYLSHKEKKIEISFFSIINELRNSVRNWKELSSIYLILFYIGFMFLPLFWGLSFYLKSDANVVVVVFFIIWVYNWTRYIFLYEKKKV
jgi:hypothetical protein